jgi:signal transduction histidine kinase
MTTDAPNEPSRKPDLLSVVAHDLKTPLTAVMKYVELLEMLGPLNDQQRDFTHKAQAVLNRMENLVRDILELAELDDALPLKMKYTDLRALVQGELELLESLISTKGIRVHVSIQDGADRVLGDMARLQQVFNNLLSNAVKYNQPEGDIWVSLRRQADVVRVDIRDSGVGIHEDDLPHIFERFYKPRHAQRERGSSGLGLSITQMIVERHGGRIWASSAPNEGSTFSFVLPSVRRGNDEYEPRLQSLESSDGIDDRLQDSEEQRPLDSHEREV